MHIAYVCADPGVPVFGAKGCSLHVQSVLRVLLGRGHRVTLLCANQGGDPPPDLGAVAIVPLPRLATRNPATLPAAVQHLAEACREALSRCADLDLIYERHALWSFSAIEAGATCGIPTCLEVNAPLLQEQQQYRTLHHPHLAEELVKRVYQAASTIIAVSSQVAATIRRQCPQVNRLHVVHNGVDVQRFQSRSERHPDQGLSIGFCGSLRPWHGVVDLIDAFAHHSRRQPASRLTIIGDGPEREAIESRIAHHGLQAHVHLSGQVAPDEIPDWLSRLDVGVAPYPALQEMYFSPLKLFEYLAAGLCPVAPRLGDIPDLIEDHRTGLLYDAGDLDQLTAVFDHLSLFPDLHRRIGGLGRALAQERHSWDAVVDRVFDLVDLSA